MGPRRQTLVLNSAVTTAFDAPSAPVLNVEPHAYQEVTANAAPMTRFESLEGRNYMVVPMVMLTEGVHAGSNGPLYYPRGELAKTPAIWNHKPVVVYHPTQNGAAISACEPAVIASRKVGIIMNTRFEPGKGRAPGRLKAEAWLETNRLKQVDSRVMNALAKKEMVEVSTGLFTDNEYTPGHWNGEPYSAVARNYRADHLAILPDEKGACSIADGAGLLRNQEGDDLTDNTEQTAAEKAAGARSMEEHQAAADYHYGERDRMESSHAEGRRGLSEPDRALADAHNKAADAHDSAYRRKRAWGNRNKESIQASAYARTLSSSLLGKGPTSNADAAWAAEDHIQDPSKIDSIHKVLAEKIKKSPTLPGGLKQAAGDPWVKDVYPTFAIFDWGGRTFSQPIAGSTTVDGVRLTGKATPLKIVQRAGYTVANADMGGGEGAGEDEGDEDKKKGEMTGNVSKDEIHRKILGGDQIYKNKGDFYRMDSDLSRVPDAQFHKLLAEGKIEPHPDKEGRWVAAKPKDSPMTKNQLISALITNRRTAWTEDDREVLNGMAPDTLEKMLPVRNDGTGTFPLTGPSGRAREPSAVTSDGHNDDNGKTLRQGARATLPNGVDPADVDYTDVDEDGMGPDGPEKDKRMARNQAQAAAAATVEEFITNAPAGLRDPLAAMYRAHNSQKRALVGALVKNENCKFTAEQLMARPLEELQMLSTLAGQKRQTATFNNYAGLGDAGGTGGNAQAVSEPALAIPVLNFSKRDEN